VLTVRAQPNQCASLLLPFFGSETQTTQIIAGTLGSAAVAGIVVGVVAGVAAAGGGGAAAVAQLSSAATQVTTASNPLYAPTAKSGHNPLHVV